ncbi:MAG: hypothetical protein WCK02_17620 [Bacteroidota bacterium]
MKLFYLFFIFLFCSCSNNKPVDNEKVKRSYSIASEQKTIKWDSLIAKKITYTDLSYLNIFEVNFKRMTNIDDCHDSCVVSVKIIDKKSKNLVDTLEITSAYFFDDVFCNNNRARSYITEKNFKMQAVDNNYGDLIIADLNFDEKEDIAVINDSGGNGGPFYSYYIQGVDNKFHLDKFLTDSMIFFPSKIIPKKSMLITYVHAGACGVSENKFKFDKSTKQWERAGRKIIGSCGY